MDANEFIQQLNSTSETGIRWTLQNVTNEVLMEIILALLELLKTYQVKYNEEK